MLLELLQISKSFDYPGGAKLSAINDFSLVASERESVAIIGPSGCGKSTLLRITAGLEFPTSGEVRFQGNPVSGPSGERVMMFQSDSVFPWLTVRENAAFGLRQSRTTPKECAERVHRLLEEVGILDFADAWPHQLSGGMKQRLCLARSLAVRPKMLLLDEPFSAVDALTRGQLQDLLRTLTESAGITTLLVTHDVEEAIAIADRIIVMTGRPGSLLAEVKHDLLTQPFRCRIRASTPFQELRGQITEMLGSPTSLSA